MKANGKTLVYMTNKRSKGCDGRQGESNFKTLHKQLRIYYQCETYKQDVLYLIVHHIGVGYILKQNCQFIDEMDRVEKKPMSDNLASMIRRNLPFIEETVEANELFVYLIADHIIDFSDKESLSKLSTRRERASSLVSLLLSRGDRAFNGFLDALTKASYPHIVAKITGQSSFSSDGSDVGAGASYENHVPVPLQQKVANLEDQTQKHKMKLKSLSDRLSKVETREELKIIQQELNNLNAEAEKEQEIKRLNSQVQKKEEELATLTEKTTAKVQELEAEINNLKSKAVEAERELQKYKQEKAELEKRLHALIRSNEKEFQRIRQEADASNAKIKQLEESRKKDAKDHDEKIKKLEDDQKQMFSMLQLMAKGPQQPLNEVINPQAPKNQPISEPEKNSIFKSSEPNIQGSKPPRQDQPSTTSNTQVAERKGQDPKSKSFQLPTPGACGPAVTKTTPRPLPVFPAPETEIKGANSQRQPLTVSTNPSAEPKTLASKTSRSQLSLKELNIELPEAKEASQRGKP